MITLNTSSVVAIIDSRDFDHNAVVKVLSAEIGPYVVPSKIMSQISWFIETRFGQGVVATFLEDVLQGQYLLDCGDDDIDRILYLINQYSDMPLGFADAAVIACTERRGGRVVTLDLRHFGVVARQTNLQILPQSE